MLIKDHNEFKHYCELCRKEISKKESWESSLRIRKLCPGNQQSEYFMDVWDKDFCEECSKKFETWEAFESYVKLEKNFADRAESQRKLGL